MSDSSNISGVVRVSLRDLPDQNQDVRTENQQHQQQRHEEHAGIVVHKVNMHASHRDDDEEEDEYNGDGADEFEWDDEEISDTVTTVLRDEDSRATVVPETNSDDTIPLGTPPPEWTRHDGGRGSSTPSFRGRISRTGARASSTRPIRGDSRKPTSAYHPYTAAPSIASQEHGSVGSGSGVADYRRMVSTIPVPPTMHISDDNLKEMLDFWAQWGTGIRNWSISPYYKFLAEVSRSAGNIGLPRLMEHPAELARKIDAFAQDLPDDVRNKVKQEIAERRAATAASASGGGLFSPGGGPAPSPPPSMVPGGPGLLSPPAMFGPGVLPAAQGGIWLNLAPTFQGGGMSGGGGGGGGRGGRGGGPMGAMGGADMATMYQDPYLRARSEQAQVFRNQLNVLDLMSNPEIHGRWELIIKSFLLTGAEGAAIEAILTSKRAFERLGYVEARHFIHEPLARTKFATLTGTMIKEGYVDKGVGVLLEQWKRTRGDLIQLLKECRAMVWRVSEHGVRYLQYSHDLASGAARRETVVRDSVVRYGGYGPSTQITTPYPYKAQRRYGRRVNTLSLV